MRGKCFGEKSGRLWSAYFYFNEAFTSKENY